MNGAPTTATAEPRHDEIRAVFAGVPGSSLREVEPARYTATGAFWPGRLKQQVVRWIGHCVSECERPDLAEGGLNNLIDAAARLRGESGGHHRGYSFSNAWVLNTAEAMSAALTLDAAGDAAILAAQAGFRETLDRWVPILLAAQEPDGYFQTRFTLGNAWDDRQAQPGRRWEERTRGEHEGYVAGYFLEMAVAHHRATGDRRLLDAAVRLADCWRQHIGPGPGQRAWHDGHQGMEQALFRFARYVSDLGGAGQPYADLATFLLDCRGRGTDGKEYDQTHAPVTGQDRAVGHAVRAVYTTSAMADVVRTTGDAGYAGALSSVWDNLVHRKLYVTGGVGSGETDEGFGDDYSLPLGTAYCESCSNCGVLFTAHKLNLVTADARHADLAETVLYNAILGDVDLSAANFTYTNPLDSAEARYPWHVCPCCVGNIPRTLLSLPTWAFAVADDALYVNLFAGLSVDVGRVGGTPLRVEQVTDYPWDGRVAVRLHPATPARFAVHIRAPRRDPSALYTATPPGDGITAMSVNGEPADVTPDGRGYVVIDRLWLPGDRVEFEVPLPVQRVRADDRVLSHRGRVAFRRGPLVYNLETADGQDVDRPVGRSDPSAEWRPDLLGGIVALRGAFGDGSPLLAVPNYARLNRGGRSIVWVPAGPADPGPEPSREP